MGRDIENVAVIGQGYVGLPLAIRAAEVGYRVTGFDVDDERVRQLAAGQSYVGGVPSEAVQAAVSNGRYRPTSSPSELAGFDIALITVPTPLRDGVPDLGCIEAAAWTVGHHLTPGAVVVLESTTYPGTTEELVAPILEKASGLTTGTDFFLGYSPERLDPGNTEWTLVTTPKVVSGVNRRSLEVVQGFYQSIVDTTVAVQTTKAAEFTKLLENTFRYVNIALVNELATTATGMSIDIWEAVAAASTKPFGFMPFWPGPGAGGHCLPIDPVYLAWQANRTLGTGVRFVQLASEVNAEMPAYVVRRAAAALDRRGLSVSRSRVLLLGLAYKADTPDVRESPAVAVANLLLALGADVRAADPHVRHADVTEKVQRVDCTVDEVADADLVVLLTDHRAFDYEMVSANAQAVLDTRNRMRGDRVETL